VPLLFSSVYSPTHLLQLQSFLLFRIRVGCSSPTLWWSVPHFSCCYKLSPLQAHSGRWCHTRLLRLAFLFTVRMRECPVPPTLVEFSTRQPLLQAVPSPRLLGGGCPSCLLWPACLFTVRVGRAPPPLSRAQCTPPSLLHVFFFFNCLFIIQSIFSFFPGWGSFCPRGYDLFQGCLWEYRMLLSSPGCLVLPSRIGAGIWWHGSPPGLSI
jgi:hypothetical protein